ncbi:MAG: hypothetical protein JW910_14475 [Anaerolineae bacterium]|nr:hypothetical protein [Anaerolineae bacterium]
MNDGSRLAATLVIWIAFAALTGTLLTSPTGAVANTTNSGALFGIVLVLAVAATVSTGAIWASGRQRGESTESRFAKAKRARPRRIEDLVNSLEDDEVYELESLLLARDDEARKHQHGN